MIFRLKHSIGIALAAWRALAECHLIYDLRVQDPPACDATGDQNHRSIPLWEQPAVRWCTGLTLLFFWTLEMDKRRLNPKKAYHRRIPNLETVTVHRRSDCKRAYRLHAFFLKLSLTAVIKWIKNKSRSYQKRMIYRLDTPLTLDFLVAIPL